MDGGGKTEGIGGGAYNNQANADFCALHGR